MVSCSEMFICHWTKWIPTLHLLDLFSCIQIFNLSWMTPFNLSIAPWLCGWRGRPVTSLSSGQSVDNSDITAFTNSLPLSECRITGAPKVKNIWRSVLATFSARFDVRGRSTQNLLKWLIKVRIYLNSPPGNAWKLIKSIWHREKIVSLLTGFTTRPLCTLRFFFSWHSMQKLMNN